MSGADETSPQNRTDAWKLRALQKIINLLLAAEGRKQPHSHTNFKS